MNEMARIMEFLKNEYGICSQQELVEAMKESSGIDIGIFTMPVELKKEREIAV